MAKLVFPVKGVLQCLNFALETRAGQPQSADATAGIAVAACLEYLCAEVLELAGNTAKDVRLRRVIPRHINMVFFNDEELRSSFRVRGVYEQLPSGLRPKLQFVPPVLRSIVISRQASLPPSTPPLPTSSAEPVDAVVLDAYSAHADTQNINLVIDKDSFSAPPAPVKTARLILRTALPNRQYTVECDDPAWIDMSRLKFHKPLKVVLRQVHPNLGIRAAAADYTNAILHHWFSRIEARAFLAAQRDPQGDSLDFTHVLAAISEVLSGDVAKHAKAEVVQAVTMYQQSLPSKPQTLSIAQASPAPMKSAALSPLPQEELKSAIRSTHHAQNQPVTFKVVASNLNVDISDIDLHGIFSTFGTLQRVELNTGKDGHSLGTADIFFGSLADAQNAVSEFDGALIDGRELHLELISDSSAVSDFAPSTASASARLPSNEPHLV